MKHGVAALFAFLIIGITACGNTDAEKSIAAKNGNAETSSNNEKIKEAVWDQLNSKQKERIKGTWKDANVSTVTLSKDMMTLVKDKSYAGKEVYAIDFTTTSNSIPNNMIVYADKKSLEFIGLGLVD